MASTAAERKGKQPANTYEPRSIALAGDPNSAIARRAYELYERRGRQPGGDVDDWLQAEHDILASQAAT